VVCDMRYRELMCECCVCMREKGDVWCVMCGVECRVLCDTESWCVVCDMTNSVWRVSVVCVRERGGVCV